MRMLLPPTWRCVRRQKQKTSSSISLFVDFLFRSSICFFSSCFSNSLLQDGQFNPGNFAPAKHAGLLIIPGGLGRCFFCYFVHGVMRALTFRVVSYSPIYTQRYVDIGKVSGACWMPQLQVIIHDRGCVACSGMQPVKVHEVERVQRISSTGIRECGKHYTLNVWEKVAMKVERSEWNYCSWMTRVGVVLRGNSGWRER